MRLILGGINGHYLREIVENCAQQTEQVVAAVAYAADARLLFDWCWDNKIPLKYYGRLDDGVAVNVPILEKFLARKSATFTCCLVQHHHAKVIWWHGTGIYIGSANLTQSAWYSNIEAGCFIPESEITEEVAREVDSLFATLDDHATPLTEELVAAMRQRSHQLATSAPDAQCFWDSPSFTKWAGLTQPSRKSVKDEGRRAFLKEWHSTLQHLRDIGARVSSKEFRPTWVGENAPTGAQADQFLHAHYYQNAVRSRRAIYQELYLQNHQRRDEALVEALHWWRKLPAAPTSESEMLNVTAPFLREALAEDKIAEMSLESFRDVCMRVHAIRDYARRVPNKAVALPDNGTGYTIDQKVAALAKRIWYDQSSSGSRVRDLLAHLLFGGTSEQLPERLWQGVSDPRWKLDGLGISALGEIVGWALPDRFPPRNGRTSKALRSLGYEVAVHVE